MHQIRYEDCKDTAQARDWLEKMANVEAQDESDSGGGLPGPIVWRDKTFSTYDKALEYLEKTYRPYEQVGVKYKDPVKETKVMRDLNVRINDELGKKNEYIRSHMKKDTCTSKYVGCVGCGSKLSREHLSGNHCPMCGTDLRSISTLKRIEAFDKKVKMLRKRLEDETAKQAEKNGNVRWLVKFEYHC